MAKGSWNRYAEVRKQYLGLIAAERAAGRTKYIASLQRELVACRLTHYAKGRQRRYNLQFSA
jgi:hypothetical protein